MPPPLLHHPLVASAGPHLPAGLWGKTAVLLAICLAAACFALALMLLPGHPAGPGAAMTAFAAVYTFIGCTRRPAPPARLALLTAAMFGACLGFTADGLSPYLPGLALPALGAEMLAFLLLWALHYAPWPPDRRLRIAAAVVAAQLLLHLLALALSRYCDQDYLQLALADTGLSGMLVNTALSTYLAVQVERQVQLTATLPPDALQSRGWFAAIGLLGCLAGYCGDGAARFGQQR